MYDYDYDYYCYDLLISTVRYGIRYQYFRGYQISRDSGNQ